MQSQINRKHKVITPKTYTPDGATLVAFLRSRSKSRMIRGPRGSGKSTVIVWAIWLIMTTMRPMTGTKIRSSRWAFVAATYPRIQSTALKEWMYWFGAFTEVKQGVQTIATINVELEDGTTVDAQILFTAADDLQSAGKFKSTQLTGAWLVEAAEIPDDSVYKMLYMSVGRWPGGADGGASWAGIVSDTNSMPRGHWWQRYEDEIRPSDMEFFNQPPALLDAYPFDPANPVYIPNMGQDKRWGPAENIKHCRGGFNYYMDALKTYSREWIQVFIQNKYGRLSADRLVYPEYRDDEHATTKLFPYRGIPLRLGFDWGLTPSCIICQLDSYGVWRCLEEVCGNSIGTRNFARQDLAPAILKRYAGIPIIASGDPTGNNRDPSNESTCFKELDDAIGIKVHKPPSNLLIPRREAVAGFLSQSKKFLLDVDRCPKLHDGFKGAYHLDKNGVPDDVPEGHIHDALQAIILYSIANPSAQASNLEGSGYFASEVMKAMGFNLPGSQRIAGYGQTDAGGNVPVDTSGNAVENAPPADYVPHGTSPDDGMAWAVEG